MTLVIVCISQSDKINIRMYECHIQILSHKRNECGRFNLLNMSRTCTQYFFADKLHRFKNVAEVISAIKSSRELLRFCWQMFQTKYVSDKVYILVTDAKKYHKLVNFVTYNVRLCHFYGTILIIFVKNDILSKKRYIHASGSNGWLLCSYFLPGLSFGRCEWSKWMVLSRV